MKTEANWKYTPILLFRPEIHPIYEYPRMKPSLPRTVTTRDNDEEKEYIVSTSTLRCLLMGKKLVDFPATAHVALLIAVTLHATHMVWSRFFCVDFRSPGLVTEFRTSWKDS